MFQTKTQVSNNFDEFWHFSKKFSYFWKFILSPYDFLQTTQILTTNQDYNLLGDGNYLGLMCP